MSNYYPSRPDEFLERMQMQPLELLQEMATFKNSSMHVSAEEQAKGLWYLARGQMLLHKSPDASYSSLQIPEEMAPRTNEAQRFYQCCQNLPDVLLRYAYSADPRLIDHFSQMVAEVISPGADIASALKKAGKYF